MYLSPRMADGLYWLGRYQQRLETMTRESLLAFDAVIDRDTQAGSSLFARLEVGLHYESASGFLQLATYGDQDASLFAMARGARENATMVRDLLSDSLFGSVNAVYNALKRLEHHPQFDAYWLEKQLFEVEHFWGRLSTRLNKSRATQFILFGQAVEMIDLKLRLYGEVDALVNDARHLNALGHSLSEHWPNFDPLLQAPADNLARVNQSLQQVMSAA